jgi:hypothetical protein
VNLSRGVHSAEQRQLQKKAIQAAGELDRKYLVAVRGHDFLWVRCLGRLPGRGDS